MRNVFATFVALVCRVGQQQLIRGQIQNELNLSSKIDSNTLACAIDTFNEVPTADCTLFLIFSFCCFLTFASWTRH